jgi:flagellar motor switch protein FliM
MPENFLSQDEVDALLKGINGEETEAIEVNTGNIRDYDLATQERIVRGRMPTLEIINERFSGAFRIGLFNLVRRAVEVSVGPVRITKYSEFTHNLMVPSNLNLVQMKPLRGSILMVFDPSLVFMIVDNLFGGDGRFHTRVEGRDFTLTEQRIIKKVLDIVFETYASAWHPVYPIEFEYLRSEMNAQFANIATPNEVVVATTITIEIGNNSGEIHFCIPYATLEPISDVLTSPLQGETLGVDQRWLKFFTQQIQTAEVELVANIGTTTLTLNEVINMKVGDIVPLPISQEIEATIENIPVMLCRSGISKGQYALSVKKLLRPNSTEYIKGSNSVD